MPFAGTSTEAADGHDAPVPASAAHVSTTRGFRTQTEGPFRHDIIDIELFGTKVAPRVRELLI